MQGDIGVARALSCTTRLKDTGFEARAYLEDSSDYSRRRRARARRGLSVGKKPCGKSSFWVLLAMKQWWGCLEDEAPSGALCPPKGAKTAARVALLDENADRKLTQAVCDCTWTEWI